VEPLSACHPRQDDGVGNDWLSTVRESRDPNLVPSTVREVRRLDKGKPIARPIRGDGSAQRRFVPGSDDVPLPKIIVSRLQTTATG